MPTPLFIKTMRGLGDNIYSRPFVRAEATRRKVILDTPWPELFEDFDVRFVRPETKLRTQAKNVVRNEGRQYSPPLIGVPQFRLAYGAASLQRFGSITNVFRNQLPLLEEPYVFDLPTLSTWGNAFCRAKPIAFVRPVTSRTEWLNTARNPKPEYIYGAALRLMKTHHVVLVADIDDKNEWLEGELPPHHTAFIRGELPLLQMLALLRDSAVAVGGVGWLVAAAIALRVPAFIVCGGMGGHNAPEVVTDPAMDLSRIHFALPRDYCRCTDKLHACKKDIPDFGEQWAHFARTQGIQQ